ncbi:efflux RND transporter periplasmic adaptor subunit [Pleionea sp. CnH1-48]|uniref:efflux RND transporter periplasmic adaptor subunit n=1 Tax=Pleionea sp. CnH1-48 TaxID=2954494 RepID=UPI002096C866|nr:efflux RND transporter periplasmic adaptor subunit [Pleionea sp. CnH1-48]MCO7224174.1 efflux RND transporter periplasmic adaptor subunit [Pleionea sp. CnH1-48]
MNNLAKTLFVLFVGLLIGAALMWHLAPQSESVDAKDDDQPLYWVAPMDSNYRRDGPGKSPMGMDLIPVYANDSASNTSAGEITISPQVENNLGVRIAEVQKQILRSNIKTVGYVQYDEEQLIHIHPRVEGWIEKLYVKAAGDPVTKQQPLYDIYSPALVNAQEEYVLALSRKNQRLVQAAKNRLRALQLPNKAIQQLTRDRKVQQTITQYAPQDGVVDNLNIREGFYVKPGTTLMSIGTLDQVWVEAEVFERQAGQVKKNQAVSMTLDFLPGKVWHGQVDYIYPSLEQTTRTLKVRLRFNNQKALLKPNMFAQVIIHTQNEHPTILVPREAVIRTGRHDRVVLALGEGRFKSINVKLGRTTNEVAEILDGLSEGEHIVTSAQFLLDSESSKTSDFRRMSHDSNHIESANVDGVINAINEDTRVINISRGPIDKWDRPAATLDFVLDDHLNLNEFSIGQTINFTFEIRDEFVITQWRPISQNKHRSNQGAQP